MNTTKFRQVFEPEGPIVAQGHHLGVEWNVAEDKDNCFWVWISPTINPHRAKTGWVSKELAIKEAERIIELQESPSQE